MTLRDVMGKLTKAIKIDPVLAGTGDASCETPDAVAYIAKIWSRKARP